MATEIDTEAYPPGELIREELEARGWSQQDLADAMGKSHVLVSEIVHAKRSITRDTALALAAAFGTSAELWLNLDARYRLDLATPKPGNDPALRAKLYAKLPIRKMVKRGWLRETKDLADLEQQVLAFVERPSLDDEFAFDHAARKSGTYRTTKPEQAAWLCRARQLSRLVTVRSQWRAARLDDLITELRRLILSPPALRELPRVLAEFGIRLVVVERLPAMSMDGATFWLSGTEPVIALACTHDRIDNADWRISATEWRLSFPKYGLSGSHRC